RSLQPRGIPLPVLQSVSGEQAVPERQHRACGAADRRWIACLRYRGFGLWGRCRIVSARRKRHEDKDGSRYSEALWPSVLAHPPSLCHPTTVTRPPAIEARNLRLTLGEGEAAVEVLRGVDLSVSTGETLA